MGQMKFYELAVGVVFTAWGRRYRKMAMSMAGDERGWGCVFMGETEVVSDGPLLAPEAVPRVCCCSSRKTRKAPKAET